MKSALLESAVIFSAARSTPLGPVTEETDIYYDHVFTNIGNGFDQISSKFKAPVKGVYWFSFSCRGIDEGVLGAVISLVQNGANVVRTRAGVTSSGGNSVALTLQPGDEVWTVLMPYHDKAIYGSGSRYTTFSGYLMTPLL